MKHLVAAAAVLVVRVWLLVGLAAVDPNCMQIVRRLHLRAVRVLLGREKVAEREMLVVQLAAVVVLVRQDQTALVLTLVEMVVSAPVYSV